MGGDRLDSLAKAWPRRMAKVNVGSRRPAALTRSLGNQRIDVLGVLGEGAFAVVFSCKLSKDQRDVAVKVEYQVSTLRALMCPPIRVPWLQEVPREAEYMAFPSFPDNTLLYCFWCSLNPQGRCTITSVGVLYYAPTERATVASSTEEGLQRYRGANNGEAL